MGDAIGAGIVYYLSKKDIEKLDAKTAEESWTY